MAPSLAYADRKSFTNTYEYATLPEGQTEVEIWHTQSRDSWDKGTAQHFEEKLEIEHGITDHWDMSMYTIFTQGTGDAMTPAQPFGLDAVSVESRYRFADRGQWPVDTVGYLELEKDFGKSIYELEAKIIVARDFDRITAAANVIGEIAFGSNVGETEPEIGWAAGVTYELDPKVRVGVETWGMVEDEELSASVGPALSLAPSGKFWLVGGVGFGVVDAAQALSGRIIMGLEL